jgi:hypothetical protein
MARVEAWELDPEVRRVLAEASTGKAPPGTNAKRGFLTAYQILQRLPRTLQDRLATEYGDRSGKGAGEYFSPATRVAQVAATIVDPEFLDTRDLQFKIGQPESVDAGYSFCALFRLP